MRHLHTGRKLGVAPDHRRALLRSLTLALLEHETIRTTPARAKELRWYADRVVTLAKRGDLASRRQIVRLLGSTETNSGTNRIRRVLDNLYSNLAPRFSTRPGGYTQMFRLMDRRPGDNAELCLLRYIPGEESAKSPSKPAKSDAKKTTKAPKAEKQAKAKKSEDAESDKPKKTSAKKATKKA